MGARKSIWNRDWKIVTVFDHPPISDYQFDWVAWIDGKEDGHIGYGDTEADAVYDLVDLVFGDG